MYHFFIEASQKSADQITITGADVNHMKNVLRMKLSEQVRVSDGAEKEYLCEIVQFEKDSVLLKVLMEEEPEAELPAELILFQGLPKADKMELIIQKAVELGVSEIVPVSTKRTIVKLDSKKEAAKRKRWQSISESAAKQSGRTKIPAVRPVITFKEALDEAGNMDIAYIPYELETDMISTVRSFEKVVPGKCIGIIIGPEGGFEEAEIEAAKAAGIFPVTLGKRILRTETAGLMLLSVFMFRLEGYSQEA